MVVSDDKQAVWLAQDMTRTLKRIEPMQFGKISGVLNFLLSLFFVPFCLFFPILATLSPEPVGNSPRIAIVVMSLAFALFLPLMYAVMGFLIGVTTAWIYNLVARRIGGLEFETD
jgi:hypothetical protein